MIFKPSSDTDIKGLHKYLSAALIFVFTVLAVYCICVFGPLFLISRGGKHHRNHDDPQIELTTNIITSQTPIILISLLAGVVVVVFYIRQQAKRKLVTQVLFDDKSEIIDLVLLNFYTEQTQRVQVPYAHAEIELIKKYDGAKVDELKILFKKEKTVFAGISSADYLWEKDILKVKAMCKKLQEVIPSLNEKSKKDQTGDVMGGLFKR